MTINEHELANFLRANLLDCGYEFSHYSTLLMANIVIDFLALQGYEHVEYDEYD